MLGHQGSLPRRQVPSGKKLLAVVTELFIRGRKLNISIVFMAQSDFKVPKDVRLNSTHLL